MPLNAASGRSKTEDNPPRDFHPGDGIRKEKREKILICHNNNTIEVNSAALRDHKRHGDSMGACLVEEDLGPTLLEALNLGIFNISKFVSWMK